MKLSFNIMLEHRDDLLSVRYYQIGILEDGRFSGCIRDYVGGGEFDDFDFIDDQTIEEFLDDDEVDGDLSEDTLEEHKPGLLKEVRAFMDEHFEFREDYLIAPKAPLLALFEEAGEDLDRLLSNDEALEPIEVGNTSFP